MPIIYHKAPKSASSKQSSRITVSTPQGGSIIIDSALSALLDYADGKDATEIKATFQTPGGSPETIDAALACLAEAGLLVREGPTAAKDSPPPTHGALVSIVIVNFNSHAWLHDCLASISHQTYHPLEVIVVDNASSDGSIAWLKETYPKIKLISLENVQALSSAINLGIEIAEGAFLLLLNPDVTLAPEAIAQMVLVADQDAACAAVAAKLKFSWAPAFLNGLGNWVGAFSWATDNGLGHLDLGQFDSIEEVPSACFAAALIPREAWAKVGPLDENFSLYYEDTEWSYRARLFGLTVRAAPKAIVYHAFGRRVHTGEDVDLTPQKLSNVVYGRLRFAMKLLGKKNLVRFLSNYILEDILRTFHGLLLFRWRTPAAYWTGWLRFLKSLKLLIQERSVVQSQRIRSDIELLALNREVSLPIIRKGIPELTWDLVVHHYWPMIKTGKTSPLPEFARRRPKLIIISNDVVDEKMAGPGMRYLEIARVLAEDIDVTLAVPEKTSLVSSTVNLVSYSERRPEELRKLVDACEVALISGVILSKFPFLLQVDQRLVVDLYDPFILENLHYYLKEPLTLQEDLNAQSLNLTNRLAQLGDYFVCGSERQRDFWIGVLAANGRLNPSTFIQDSSLRALIDVVGIGFVDREPRHQPILRGQNPLIPEDAKIVLWGGGIWDWLDPLTLVRAWPQVLSQHPQARLIFLGTRHPNPLVPFHEIVTETEKLAVKIGEKDRTIIFYEWFPYEQREAVLCEAHVGVSLHPLHIETRFAIRTRVLDYFWARLPVLVTDGDIISEWVRQYDLGYVVPPQDVSAVAEGLHNLLEKPKSAWNTAFEALPKSFTWKRTVTPLRDYCLEGEAAADRHLRPKRLQGAVNSITWRSRLARARYIWSREGPRGLFNRVWRYIQWRISTSN